jgi:hypothetical protein
MKFVLISIWFQALWFIAVLGRADEQALLMFLITLTLALNLKVSTLPMSKILVLVVTGICVDQLNIVFNVLDFGETTFIPIWLVGLWVAFQWYANYLLPIVDRFSTWAVMAICAAGGSASYFAGMKFGAVEWPLDTAVTLVILGIEWALMSLVIVKVHGYGLQRAEKMAQ